MTEITCVRCSLCGYRTPVDDVEFADNTCSTIDGRHVFNGGRFEYSTGSDGSYRWEY